jgi:hypothetical protein
VTFPPPATVAVALPPTTTRIGLVLMAPPLPLRRIIVAPLPLSCPHASPCTFGPPQEASRSLVASPLARALECECGSWGGCWGGRWSCCSDGGGVATRRGPAKSPGHKLSEGGVPTAAPTHLVPPAVCVCAVPWPVAFAPARDAATRAVAPCTPAPPPPPPPSPPLLLGGGTIAAASRSTKPPAPLLPSAAEGCASLIDLRHSR